MEVFIEFVFDVVVEGCLNLIANKKIPFIFRILMGMVLGLVFGGLFLLLITLMFLSLRSHDYIVAFILFFIVLAYSFFVYKAFKLKIKEARHEVKR